jgi:hypothetical protein
MTTRPKNNRGATLGKILLILIDEIKTKKDLVRVQQEMINYSPEYTDNDPAPYDVFQLVFQALNVLPKKRKINMKQSKDTIYIEALDRCNTIGIMIDTLLEDHPAVVDNEDIKLAYEKASSAVADLYQTIGNKMDE